MSDQKKLSKFGKFLVTYFTYFSLSGVLALISILFIWFSGGFKNNFFAFFYIATWSALYFISSYKSAKEILKYKKEGSKRLFFYTFLWFIATFWPCLLYGSGAEDNIAFGMFMIIYILAAYPYILLAFLQIPGLIILSLFPLFHAFIVFIAWRKTYLLYGNVESEFRFE